MYNLSVIVYFLIFQGFKGVYQKLFGRLLRPSKRQNFFKLLKSDSGGFVDDLVGR